jgi:hypothetical protein
LKVHDVALGDSQSISETRGGWALGDANEFEIVGCADREFV